MNQIVNISYIKNKLQKEREREREREREKGKNFRERPPKRALQELRYLKL